MAQGKRSLHPVDEVPPVGPLAALGFQHLLIMYAATIAPPYVIGNTLGLPPAEIAQMVSANVIFAGIGTILTSIGLWKIGARLPIVLGPSAIVVGPIIMIGKSHGLPTVWGACIITGLAMVLFAPVVGRLRRFFPPIVMGTMLSLIGLMLIPIGVRLITDFKPTSPAPARNMIMAFGTMAFVALLTRLLPRAFRQMAILFGLIAATIVATILGQADLSRIWQGNLFGVALPADFGHVSFDLGTSISVIILMIILMFEVLSQITAVGELVDKATTQDNITGAIYADGLTTLIGGFFGAIPVVTFAQNIGALSLSQTRSRYITTAAGVFLVLLGFFPPLGRLIAAIPGPIIGGLALVMFTMIGVVGIKILSQVDFDRPQNLLIVATSLGVGLIPMVAPEFYGNWHHDLRAIFDSPVGAGMFSALALNFLFNQLPEMGATKDEIAAPETDAAPRASNPSSLGQHG